MIQEDLRKIYPDLMKDVTIRLIELQARSHRIIAMLMKHHARQDSSAPPITAKGADRHGSEHAEDRHMLQCISLQADA